MEPTVANFLSIMDEFAPLILVLAGAGVALRIAQFVVDLLSRYGADVD